MKHDRTLLTIVFVPNSSHFTLNALIPYVRNCRAPHVLRHLLTVSLSPRRDFTVLLDCCSLGTPHGLEFVILLTTGSCLVLNGRGELLLHLVVLRTAGEIFFDDLHGSLRKKRRSL